MLKAATMIGSVRSIIAIVLPIPNRPASMEAEPIETVLLPKLQE